MIDEVLKNILQLKNHNGSPDKIEFSLKIEDDKKRFLIIKVEEKEYKIAFEEIHSAMFLMGDDEEQEKLIMVKTRRVRHIVQPLEIELKEDMKKGEIIKVNNIIKVPEECFIGKKDKKFVLCEPTK